MMMKLFQWHYGLLLLPFTLWLSINSAHADITCTANMNNGTVNISNTITPANANDAQITATLTYSCTNNVDSARYASLCLGVDGGDYDSATLNPRYMTNLNNNSVKLAFTMTQPNGSVWGNSNDSTYKPATFLIGPKATVNGSAVITVSLLPGFDNTLATQGDYSSDFTGNHTTLTYQSYIDQPLSDCNNGIQKPSHFPFKVQATVANECKIIAKPTDINLGNIAASATNIKGSTSISLKCTNTAPYTIGLVPSNDSVDGVGVMTGTTPNSDVIPYQLQSADGRTWGNTVTAESLGNGVADEGNGTEQLHTVYVTVPSADVKPDNYSDTVTIHVNY
jgi:spore coat protein U-like protein